MKPTRKVTRRSFLGSVTGRTPSGQAKPVPGTDVDLGMPEGKAGEGKPEANDADG